MPHTLSDLLIRLEALESHVMHQERKIADLNEVITDQWKTIGKLKREHARLEEEMKASFAERDAPEPPPPHY